ncbi:ABC transporter ATP-binding protein [Domibacillus sp. DTU_2020_1001157_1_SI_ALB_TIR_016]|uniref:ABC transporter ATP-binding protein n=1 Tax=Domibacillus sp. DTU_2020_1001157_1_SI_ALB_TIR_016 TaxID=3077789 RepID=UPI0028EAF927|nr:ABC transporter ATP-binding protein [Domibacillus sp. DTU_2020_1001157_1_SI_ALB_TIR_016]WNS78480.1 ABC transporter ATP-binding protein [Domibacillus sp. DTU_2020_1001157_1_SI_ALB_TIR_016]
MAKSLHIQSLSKRYGKATALDGIQLDVRKGEFISLLGPSGCGKSTLLRIIAGLDDPSSGSVLMDGVDVTSSSPASRNIGMVFQSYALFPNMSVLKNIEFALKPRKLSSQIRKEKAARMLETVGLSDFADRMPHQLSGGQQQRVALARALVVEPDFLLLDEPLSALDANVRYQLQREIRRIHDKFGMTTIMVTHDQDEALTMADRIAVMTKGQIVQFDTPQKIYRYPADSFVASFIGTSNQILSGGKMKVIRPEHFTVADIGEGIEVKVESIHFKGAFYRLTVRVLDRTSPSFNEKWAVDLQASLVEEKHVRIGELLNLLINEGNLIPVKEVVTR